MLMVPRELNFVKKVGDFKQISGIKISKIKGVVWAVKNVSSEVSVASIVELGVDRFADFEHKMSSQGVDDISAIETFVVSNPDCSLNSPAKYKENEHDAPK